MGINQIEKPNFSGFVIKVVFIAGLTAVSMFYFNTRIKNSNAPGQVLSETKINDIVKPPNKESIIDNLIEHGSQTANNLINQAKDVVIDTASQSAKKIEYSVIQTVTNKFVEQIDKLPPGEKEEIKREICK